MVNLAFWTMQWFMLFGPCFLFSKGLLKNYVAQLRGRLFAFVLCQGIRARVGSEILKNVLRKLRTAQTCSFFMVNQNLTKFKTGLFKLRRNYTNLDRQPNSGKWKMRIFLWWFVILLLPGTVMASPSTKSIFWAATIDVTIWDVTWKKEAVWVIIKT